VICTRWHVDDLLGRLMLKFPEMRVLSFQAIAEEDEQFRRKGEALFPSLKPLGMLLDQKRLMSEASWQAEYQQRPYVVGGASFRSRNCRSSRSLTAVRSLAPFSRLIRLAPKAVMEPILQLSLCTR
jgi:hypothetical protein